MAFTRANALALAGSATVSLAMLGAFLYARRPADPIQLLEADEEAARAALEAEPERVSDPERPWLDWPYHVPEASANELFPILRQPDVVYDPWCGFVYAPHSVRGRKWPEHPDGEYSKRTNSLGIRTATEPRAEKPRVRILVAGDSHVDGVCRADETYPFLLESALRSELDPDDVEVLNAGMGGYSLVQYLGTLERFAHLDLVPDLFVVTVFCGNDLTEVLTLWRFLHGMPREFRKPKGQKNPYGEFAQRQRRARGPLAAAYGQGVSSAAYARTFPERMDWVHGVATTTIADIRARCAELGTELLVVLLPSPTDFPEQPTRELIERGLADAGLDDSALADLRAMRERVAAWLAREGIEHVDLYDSFQGRSERLYWTGDLHLSVEGHALAARAVEPAVRRILGL